MAESSVLDTSVLIGLSIENDQHHKTCFKYVIDCDGDCWVTPTTRSEYNKLANDIREQLHDEITAHRHTVQQEVNGNILSRDELQWIRDNLISNDPSQFKAYTFLHKWYNDLMSTRVQIHKNELIGRLSNKETEPFQDAAADHGGWRSLVSFWTQGSDSYPTVKAELLPEGNDEKICVEGHHIAVTSGDAVNLATADGDHCGQKDGESESRKENIERVTRLGKVIDLQYPLRPN